jgi:outer membrane lipoprotein SlyB
MIKQLRLATALSLAGLFFSGAGEQNLLAAQGAGPVYHSAGRRSVNRNTVRRRPVRHLKRNSALRIGGGAATGAAIGALAGGGKGAAIGAIAGGGAGVIYDQHQRNKR